MSYPTQGIFIRLRQKITPASCILQKCRGVDEWRINPAKPNAKAIGRSRVIGFGGFRSPRP